MRLQDIMNFDTFITGVMFGEGTVEITFLEKQEQTDGVMIARTMVLPIDDEERLDAYAEIQDGLRHMVEWGYVELRNPPQQYTEPAASSREWAHRQMTEASSPEGE